MSQSSSPLVKHDPRYRRLWMFPRNIRRISPWKIAQILPLYLDQTRSGSWAGNQELQNKFRKALEQLRLIQPGEPYDPHSGGSRTYESQMSCLGLVFKRPSDRTVWPTLAGEDLVQAGNSAVGILQSQLLRHQYPSYYSSLVMVRVHPDIKVKPFLFVIELLKRPGIESLSTEELCIAVIYGHNRSCLDICAEKIIAMRSGRGLSSLIDHMDDVYTPRSGGSTIEKRLSDIRDIANTCKNYIQATDLIIVRTGSPERITLNPDLNDVYENAIKDAEHFIPNPDNPESFQRNYGAWDRTKDTRRLTVEQSTRSGEMVERGIVRSLITQEFGFRMTDKLDEGFKQELRLRFGFSEPVIRAVYEELLPRSVDIFSANFLALSVGGADAATEFEKAVCLLLDEKLYLKTKHTGQLFRGGKGGYADGFSEASNGTHCAILDTKASPRYALTSDDFYTMTGNYIPHYGELTNKSLQLEYVLYVAGGFSPKINNVLEKMKLETGIPCSAIRASELLALVSKSPQPAHQEVIRKTFRKGMELRASDFSL